MVTGPVCGAVLHPEAFAVPLYEYECEKCGHRFENIQKFSDPLLEECPECGGKIRKLLSAPAIQFKGQGWYITDYARKGREDPDAKEKKPSDDAGKSKKKTEASASASSSKKSEKK